MKKISDLIRDFETNCNPQDIKVKHGDNDFEVYPWIKPFIFSSGFKLVKNPNPVILICGFSLNRFFRDGICFSVNTKQ